MKIIPFILGLILFSSIAFAVQCGITNDLTCPDTIPECSASFAGGLGCVVDAGFCHDSGARSYTLNESTPLTITLTQDAYALSVFFVGYNGSTGTMDFRNAGDSVVDSINSNGDCMVSNSSLQEIRFSEPVRSIDVYGDGNLYLDTVVINPSTLCLTTDTVCDGIDNDCDGLIDEDANSTCNDGLFCNGLELCLNGACQAGTAVDCSVNNIGGIDTCFNDPDNNALTLDSRAEFISSCSEDTDSCTTGSDEVVSACSLVCGAGCAVDADCVHLGVDFVCDLDTCGCIDSSIECFVDADCDDSLYCTGTETCVNNICVPGVTPVIADNITCSTETCNEALDITEHIANNTFCDDGNICTSNYCDVINGCQTTPIQLGKITCGVGACQSEINRCINGVEQACVPGTPGLEICDGIDNNCNGLVDEDDVCDVSMTIHEPNGDIYSERRIAFDIQVSQEVDTISMIDNADVRPRWKTLCRRCDDYGHDRPKAYSFKDGFHNITIQAQKGGYVDFESRSFFVDSTKPRITKWEPRRGYANGLFHVQFRENNPTDLTLYYGNESDLRAKDLNLSSCFEVRRGTTGCDVQVNISEFDGQEIQYYFRIVDIANNSFMSRASKLDVDITPPEILHASTIPSGRRVDFNVSISEEVTLQYMDLNASRPSWRSLCRGCDSYERTRTFRTGEHTLLIRATDGAGNQDVEETRFVI